MKKLTTSLALMGLILAAGLIPSSFTLPVRAEENLNVRIVGASLGGSVNRSYAAFAQAFMKEYPGANVGPGLIKYKR